MKLKIINNDRESKNNVAEQDNNENSVDSQLELLKYTSEVQSRIKDQITSDFVLCKLNEKDKEAITEMTTNAYFTKRLFTQIHEKAWKFDWDNITQTWIKRKLNEKEIERLNQLSNRTFDSFMERLYMVSILNRNVDKNYLLRILAGLDTPTEKIEDMESEKDLKTKLKEMIKPNKKDKLED